MTADPRSPDVHHDPDARRFHTLLDGYEAELLYSLRDGRMIINHTGVPDQIGGRGVAATLVKAALDHARAQGWRVVPACSYSAAYVERHPEYAGLVDA
ncbi:GNAT family N-acetyltransferase [Pseudoxanthomonas sp. Root630]|uniref:GNAT family N-acetyltransferase n=1 Tax=Pseudoxanthomonas sp. Root630 TaxID=1736574 RepID=UPI000702AE57|nr:GNAT family N-acetyltransferase [Pseudoxanthomonas sp. Root630]KRA44296.1 acetyltransferase [Pseudoxanthomonas sp. Root630]